MSRNVFYFCQANLEMSGELTFPAALRLKSCIEGQKSKNEISGRTRHHT